MKIDEETGSKVMASFLVGIIICLICYGTVFVLLIKAVLGEPEYPIRYFLAIGFLLLVTMVVYPASFVFAIQTLVKDREPAENQSFKGETNGC